MNPLLTIADVVKALELFDDRYNTIDVFADDVEELRTYVETDTLPQNLQLTDTSGTRFAITGTPYVLDLIADAGVARITRTPQSSTTSVVGNALAGGAIGTAIGVATSKKAEVVATGLILGLLVGATLGNATPNKGNRPRRVFALCFDSDSGQWLAYDGGLVRWMKAELGRATG